MSAVPAPALPCLLVAGVGLIGGSFAAALRGAGRVGRVLGLGRGRANLERALALGIIDEVVTDPAAAAARADVVLLAVPVAQTAAVLASLRPGLRPGCLVTDGGSTKVEVIAQARAVLGEAIACFVPAHPVAGAERSGVEAARADLYAGRRVILTPLAENAAHALAQARDLWAACGARVSDMDPLRHDQVLGLVSHLPHVLAFALVDLIATDPAGAELFAFAGAGFRDFTRIAGSSPEMWRDIVASNRAPVLDGIARLRERLDALHAAIGAGDDAAVEAVFARARAARGQYLGGADPRTGPTQDS